jgi:alpha-aminoadipic semialdehyde synthase
MSFTLGIRREDKNKWERRVPLVPEHVKELKEKYGIETIIQPSKIRAFSEKDFGEADAVINEDLSSSSVVFAIKEIPIEFFETGKTYVFFSHTIKGQKYNIPMLKKMMELGCNLVDYEKITDEKGHRLVFFGRYAGLAGMIDTLWAFGQRMRWKEVKTPFVEIKQTIDYRDLDDAEKHIMQLGKTIDQDGLPDSITPFVVGFAGYGNVSGGAQEILDILPVKEITPKQLEATIENPSNRVIYKVVFKEEDMVEPISTGKDFDLQEYYTQPHLYRSVFEKYVNRLTILINCIYWDKQYPRLITKKFMKEKYDSRTKLQVIGDISVDITGAIEFTKKATSPGNPIFVYNHLSGEIIDGYTGNGIVVMAVDNLPCELPRESSRYFSETLMRFIPSIVKADFSVDFDSLALSPEIKKAVILHHGKLTPNYQYINKYL